MFADLAQAPPSNMFADFIASDIDAQKNIYNQQDYAPVTNSPIDRNAVVKGSASDVPDIPTTLAAKAMADDAANAPPVDKRREVGAGEVYWRTTNEFAAKSKGLIEGAVGALGYPITAADAALSGRPVPSFGEAVSNAAAPAHAQQQQYAIDPAKEKYGLAGEIASGFGQLTADLPVMLASAPAKAAQAGAEGIGLAEQLATRLFHTAQISSVPAARNAKEAA